MITADLIESVPGERIVLKEPWAALTAELKRCPSGPVAVFTGRRSVEANGAWAHLEAVLRAADRNAVRFSEIEAEPGVETVERMAALLQEVNPAAVIALGGGSVMDAAKAAYLMMQSGWKLEEHFGSDCYSRVYPEAAPDRVICIPTTSGTGSEATPYANIVDHRLGVKKLISERFIVPALALSIPAFTHSMPPAVTRATGCDALAHLIEGFLNVGADANSALANEWALTGIRLVVENLPAAIADGGNAAARNNMSMAATLGGMVIRFKSTGLPHLCSFSWFGRLEHGIAVAMLLPASWSYYLGNPKVAERTMRLADYFPGDEPRGVIASYRRFLDSVGVPGALKDCDGITPELLAATAASGSENRMKLELAPYPVPVSDSERILGGILKQAYLGEF